MNKNEKNTEIICSVKNELHLSKNGFDKLTGAGSKIIISSPSWYILQFQMTDGFNWRKKHSKMEYVLYVVSHHL